MRPRLGTRSGRLRDYAEPVGAALVTGAGRGLGLEIARVLARRGLTVHLTDVDAAAALAAAEEIGGGAFGSALDVRDPEACSAAAAMTVERAGIARRLGQQRRHPRHGPHLGAGRRDCAGP